MYAAAKKEGILEAYRPADSDAIAPEMRDPENYWTGVGAIPLCFLTNTKFLKKNNMEAPTKWADLLVPRYKRNLQMADARASGTATERIFSLVKIMGEDEAVNSPQPTLRFWLGLPVSQPRWTQEDFPCPA